MSQGPRSEASDASLAHQERHEIQKAERSGSESHVCMKLVRYKPKHACTHACTETYFLLMYVQTDTYTKCRQTVSHAGYATINRALVLEDLNIIQRLTLRNNYQVFHEAEAA